MQWLMTWMNDCVRTSISTRSIRLSQTKSVPAVLSDLCLLLSQLDLYFILNCWFTVTAGEPIDIAIFLFTDRDGI